MDTLDSSSTPPAQKDAIDEFIALPQEQQVSTLQSLAPDKQDQLLSKVKERRVANTPKPDYFKSVQNSFDTNTTTSPNEPLLETGLKRVVRTVGAPFVHPLDTMQSMAPSSPGEAILGPAATVGKQIIQRGKEAVGDYKEGGLPYAATKLAGDATGAYLGGKAGEGVINGTLAIPEVARGVIGGKAVKGAAADLIDSTAADNATAQAKADAANAKLTQSRAQQLQDHFAKTQAVNEANTATEAAQSRKAALQRGVETLDPIHKTDLQNLEGTVRAEANRRYNDLNTQLDPEVAPPETLPDLLESASEKMKGSNTETPIMKDMERRLNSQEPLTYRDLQGYRSEIGRELQKKDLAGDVYHAYKDMMSDITDHMSEIAKSKGLGDDFDSARSYYRQMSDTFDDPRSPIRRALNSTEPGGVVRAFAGKDKSGIEALAKYDSDLADRINTTRGYAAEAKGIRSSTAQPKAAPTLPPKPAPIAPDLTQIGPSDIADARTQAAADRAIDLHKTGSLGHMASGIAAFDAARSLIQGNWEHALLDVAARGAVATPKLAVAKLLESPRVQQWLSTPTHADLAELAKLPPEQRTAAAQSLQPLIDAAKAKGVPIAPAIIGMLAGKASLPSGHPLALSHPAQ